MKLHGFSSRCFLATLIGFLLTGLANAQTYYYVATNGSGSGTSWVNAYTNIQTALDVATNGDTVCIAGGQTFSLTQQLTMARSGVSVIGGYQGSGTPGSRDPSQYETIITRNAAVTDMRLLKVNSVQNILVDGITFTGGRLLNSENGAGIYLSATTNATVRNCRIMQNGVYAWGVGYTTYGGGIFMENPDHVTIADCDVSANQSGAGGGVFVTGGNVVLTNCIIRDNQAVIGWSGGGGAVSCNNSAAVDLSNCIISGNYGDNGGGMDVVSSANARLKNCLVTYNASGGGAGFRVSGAALTLENCTVFGNKGSGVWTPNNGDTLNVTNSILWGNGTDVLLGGGWQGHTYRFSYSLFGNGSGTAVPSCISADPLFQYHLGFYLLTNSPCVNAGTGTVAEAGLTAFTTRADGTLDTGTVDIGYHYLAGFQATNLYVSPSGNDTWAGTEVAPLKTITHALAISIGGEIIHLAAGTYSADESFPLTFSSKNRGIEIVGEDPATTVIVGGSARAFQISGVNSFVLRNVTIRDSYRYEPGGGGAAAYLMAVGSTTISNCWISGSGCGFDGWHMQPGGAISHQYGSLNLMDCIFSNNTAGWSGAGGAVYTANGTMNATRCVFKNNFAQMGNGGAVYIDGSSCAMSNVLFTTNRATSSGDAIYVASGSLVLQNATIVSNGVGSALRNAGGTASVRDSIFWGNGDDVTGTVALAYCDVEDGDNAGTNGCVSVNPRFVDQTYFHLESPYGQYIGGYFTNGTWSTGVTLSPGIDAGNPSIRPTKEPSRNGALINMGAYGNTAVASKSPPLTVAIRQALDIHPTYATLQGELVAAGDPDVTLRFYWGKTDQGTVAGAWTTNALIGGVLNAPGVFSLQVSNLEYSVTYHYTCFASNSVGDTAWASSTNFITQIAAPNVANKGVDNEASTTPTLKGEITNNGGEDPTVYVCWGAWEGSNNTSTWEHVDNIGIKSGTFSHQVTISSGSGYYYTCYAVNSAGNAWAPAPNLTFGASVRYVNPNASGAGTGYNWPNGYATVQAALAACRNDRTNIIYLVGGTYVLDQSLLLTNSHVFLRGGYSGTGVGTNAPGVQDPARWETIITRNPSINNRRLLQVSGVQDLLVDSITLAGGRFIDHGSYAGVYLNGTTNVTVRNCVIRDNGISSDPNYTDYGAGLGVLNSKNVLFDGCRILDNMGALYGPGGYLYYSTVTFTNCLVRGNLSTSGDWNGGGGVFSQGGTLTMIDCAIVGNSCSGGSGGVGSFGVSCLLKNCLIACNSGSFGGGVNALEGLMILENCTVSGNTGNGIGVHNERGATVAVTNSIVWDNGGGIVLYNGGDNNYTAAYSDLQVGKGTGGTGCLSQDPLFDSKGRYGLYLAPNSPCVNAGTGTVAEAGLEAFTTQTDGALDTGTADMGYHYSTGVQFSAMHLYVSPAGNDTAAGNESAPFKTITRALSVAMGGETIHLAAGTYTPAAGEAFPLTWKNKPSIVSIVGTNTAMTKIGNASTRVFYLANARGFDIEGLTVTNAIYWTPADGGAAIYAEKVGQLNLTRCVFSGFQVGWDGYHNQDGAALLQKNGKCTIEDCLFENGSASWTGRGGAIASLNAVLSARRCVFRNNTVLGGYGGAIYLEGGTMSLTNVLVAGNTGVYGDGIYVASGTLDLQSATIANNAGEGINNAGGTVTAHNSIIWGNTDEIVGTVGLAYCDIGASDSTSTNGCIGDDPLFYDTTYYHLQSLNGTYTNGFFSGGGFKKLPQYSSLLDAGDPASDWANEPLPNGRRIAMGAYGNTEVSDMSGVMLGTIFSVR